jgi:hypothetical protein
MHRRILVQFANSLKKNDNAQILFDNLETIYVFDGVTAGSGGITKSSFNGLLSE